MTLRSVAFILLLCSVALSAQETSPPEQVRTQARSMVISKFGIVATSQSLASVVGQHVLEAGGNAVDAAIAANAALGLVEPMSNGVGGDLFAIVYEAKTGKLYGLNASGWAPSGLTIDLLESKGFKKVPSTGIYSVTVPGAVSGWDMLNKRFGTMPLSKLLAPVIYYAENGFPVTEIISASWNRELKKLQAGPNAASVYLPDGQGAACRASIPQSRAGRSTAPDRATRPGRVLHRQDSGIDRRSFKTARWHVHSLRSEQLPGRVGGAYLNDISRLARLGTATQLRRHRRAQDAQYPGTISARRIRP